MAARAVAVTLASGVVAGNFMGGGTKIERRIEHRIEQLHAINEPQFWHAPGVLLGPRFVGGSRHRVLQNARCDLPGHAGCHSRSHHDDRV